MINYAKHDEEFYGVIKLTNGEEILAKAVLTEDEGETLIFVSSPVLIQNVMKELPDGKVLKAMGFARWMQMSDEDFFILREKDIITIASMSREVMFMYETFISDNEDDEPNKFESKALKNSDLHVEPDSKMGYLGTIEDARKLFEDIYKSSNNS
ncbi:hypothetical protein RW01021201_126 [Synechococcus phage S-RIM8]|uniref:Sm-like domain-containing protein n=2 Tax=Neptunevirus srim18 TaxID=2734121 RepID=A0A1D7SBD8_9CAUD|nr:methylamine utilization [Synechococcus phage S-RIM8 A.HR1]YP_009783036.1 methylamine utilization [Synechococcus phage S-RIM8]AFB15398.1 gp143 [Synechococcus phage S-RIM8 A.HR5]AFB17826.1 gp143 [Synechococcus phage S-RIM8 A.HR3]AGH57921.1 hypothetical protein CPJG_00169 [Synechococcus phage KBS-M-1A]AFB17614.1 gp143 [Synechococcus phage S-RIM8 A.HR1]AOO10274.1 hypothetical protein RW01021201_126 [Synechococcus phage S-RIM8]